MLRQTVPRPEKEGLGLGLLNRTQNESESRLCLYHQLSLAATSVAQSVLEAEVAANPVFKACQCGGKSQVNVPSKSLRRDRALQVLSENSPDGFPL